MFRHLCHNESSFLRLPLDEQHLIRDLSQEMSAAGVYSPYEGRQLIWKSLHQRGIRIPAGFFENIDADDSLEMWTHDLRFLFAMGSIIHKSSYTLDTLATHPWAELFTRDETFQHQALGAWKAAVTTGDSQHDITDWHWVRETRSPQSLSILLRIKQISAFHKNGEIAGIIALVKTGTVVADPSYASKARAAASNVLQFH